MKPNSNAYKILASCWGRRGNYVRRQRRSICWPLVVFLVVGAPSPGSAAQVPSSPCTSPLQCLALPLTHKGRFIVDANGEIRIFHGVNMVDKFPPYNPAVLGFGPKDAAILKHAGINTAYAGDSGGSRKSNKSPALPLHIPQSMLKPPVSQYAAHGPYADGLPRRGHPTTPKSKVSAPKTTAKAVGAATATASVAPQWFYIVYAPSLNSSTPLVLNVQNGIATNGENVILWPMTAGAPNELWEYTQSGQLVSGLGDYLYNTFTSTNNPAQPMVLSATAPSGGVVLSNPSQAGTSEGGGDAFQLWTTTGACQTAQCTSGTSIENQMSGNYLYSGAYAGAQATLGSTPQPEWVFWPPRTLQAILAESNVPYPAFTGGQLTAYNHISNALGLGGDTCTYEGESLTGLRCEYDNLNLRAGALSSWQNTMKGLRLPIGSGISPSDWTAVKKQLNTEIIDVELVQGLYTNFNDFFTDLLTDFQTTTSQMEADALASNSGGVSGKTAAILEGVLYTTIEFAGSIVPGAGPFISAAGNMMETAFNAALASNPGLEGGFQTTVGNLWKQLNSDFLSISTASANNEDSILEDWGRLQAVSALTVSSGPGSLAWNPTTASRLEKALQAPFSVAVMQMLLPTLYWIYPVPQMTTSEFIFGTFGYGFPASEDPWDYFVQNLGTGAWNQFAMANGNPIGTIKGQLYPGQNAIQNDVFGNGVNPAQFWNNLNGWQFPLWWDNYNDSLVGLSFASATGCNQLLISVINQTGVNLTLTAAATDGSLLGNYSRGLEPYATVLVGLVGGGPVEGAGAQLCATAGSEQACFQVQQDGCVTRAGNITYYNIGDETLQSKELDQTTGSYSNDVPGIVSVAVYNPNAQQ